MKAAIGHEVAGVSHMKWKSKLGVLHTDECASLPHLQAAA